MDCIHIRELEIFARHGVYEEENRLGQPFVVSADLFCSTYKAGTTDELTESVDYGSVCHLIKEEMTKHTFKLIETVAEHLARTILLKYNLIEKVSITIDKPWAPIGLHLKTAGVTITRSRHQVFVAVGSNIGDSANIVRAALAELDRIDDVKVKAVSDFYITPPYGVTDQPDFLNGCIEIETLKEPEELLDLLMAVEKMFGRERKVHWGPRTLDLDIIFYDRQIISTPRLSVPHPDMCNRQFVLEPLCQIAGWFLHPIHQKTVAQLFDELKKH